MMETCIPESRFSGWKYLVLIPPYFILSITSMAWNKSQPGGGPVMVAYQGCLWEHLKLIDDDSDIWSDAGSSDARPMVNMSLWDVALASIAGSMTSLLVSGVSSPVIQMWPKYFLSVYRWMVTEISLWTDKMSNVFLCILRFTGWP